MPRRQAFYLSFWSLLWVGLLVMLLVFISDFSSRTSGGLRWFGLGMLLVHVAMAVVSGIVGANRKRVSPWSPLTVLLEYALLAGFYVAAYFPCIMLAFILAGGEFYGSRSIDFWPVYVLFVFLPPALWLLLFRKSLTHTLTQAWGWKKQITGNNGNTV